MVLLELDPEYTLKPGLAALAIWDGPFSKGDMHKPGLTTFNSEMG